MSPDTILYAVAGLVLVLFLVAIIMGHKTWKIHTIVAACFVLIGACAFMYYTAVTLKTHKVWREILVGTPGSPETGLIARTEKLERENRDLRLGQFDEAGDLVGDGLVQISQKKRAELLDRGRRWIDCIPTLEAGASSVQVEVPGPGPHNFSKTLTLYVFDSKPKGQQGAFLGEFKVTEIVGPTPEEAAADFDDDEDAEDDADADDAVDAVPTGPTMLTLEPAWEMTPFESERLATSAQGGGPWTLYDKMPADSHALFGELAAISADELGVAEDDLANLERAARLEKLVPDSVTQQYFKDYQPAEPGDPVDRIEILVEFEKDYPPRVAGDSPTQFKSGRQVWILKEAPSDGPNALPGADELKQQGVVQFVEGTEPRYARELRDYGFLFRDVYIHRSEREAEIAAIAADTEGVERVLTEKEAIVVRLEAEKVRIEEDKKNFNRDAKVLGTLVTALQSQKASVLKELELVRRKNLALAKKIDRLQIEAYKAIDRRAPAAATSALNP